VRAVNARWPGSMPYPSSARAVHAFAVRLHLAVSLVGLLSLGFYLPPAIDLEANVAGVLPGQYWPSCDRTRDMALWEIGARNEASYRELNAAMEDSEGAAGRRGET
jgi:hypothetical protein